MKDQQSENFSRQCVPQHLDMFAGLNNDVAIFVMFKILLKMRHEVGLEAMLIYLDKFVESIEQFNPELLKKCNNGLKKVDCDLLFKEMTEEK